MAGSNTELSPANTGAAAGEAAVNVANIPAGGGVAEGGGAACACRPCLWGNPVIGPASR
jgi:hypothetical protein